METKDLENVLRLKQILQENNIDPTQIAVIGQSVLAGTIREFMIEEIAGIKVLKPMGNLRVCTVDLSYNSFLTSGLYVGFSTEQVDFLWDYLHKIGNFGKTENSIT